MSEVNEPLYLKINNYLIDEIKVGKFDAGERLPSEKELADKFNVSRITSKKAMDMLSQDGIIKRIPGKGSFVNKDRAVGDNAFVVAKNNNTNKSLIGIIIPDFSESYGIGLISGIEERSYKENFFIVTRRSHGDRVLEEEAIDDLIEVGVAGIVIMPVHGEYYSPRILKLILDGFPIVVMDRQLKGIQSTFIGSDNVNAAYKAVEYLFSIGHKNICFLSPPPINTSAIEDRIKGIIKSYSENEIAVDRDLWLTDIMSTMPGKCDSDTIISDIERIKELILRNGNITCVFAAEYNIALLACKAIKALGKKVPEDISILCFDSPGSVIDKYDFTHIKQKEEEMGRQAVELLKRQINGEPEIEGKQFFIDTDLIIGNSTSRVV